MDNSWSYEEESFHRAILAAPRDCAPRLIYGDWAMDRGDEDLAKYCQYSAEFLRLDQLTRGWPACPNLVFELAKLGVKLKQPFPPFLGGRFQPRTQMIGNPTTNFWCISFKVDKREQIVHPIAALDELLRSINTYGPPERREVRHRIIRSIINTLPIFGRLAHQLRLIEEEVRFDKLEENLVVTLTFADVPQYAFRTHRLWNTDEAIFPATAARQWNMPNRPHAPGFADANLGNFYERWYPLSYIKWKKPIIPNQPAYIEWPEISKRRLKELPPGTLIILEWNGKRSDPYFVVGVEQPGTDPMLQGIMIVEMDKIHTGPWSSLPISGYHGESILPKVFFA